ncbi:MAG TPA: sigma-70 family RNA polymerase sigma factor [Polyangiales bacterium]|nr:sigma-70 family RNA polymerase sigma factor [Polyangiales bacterium]
MDSAAEPSRTSVELVVQRAVSGDVSAEREVLRRLLPAMRAFAQRRLPPAAAEDFTQDALLLLVEALREGRIQDPARAAGFALGICRNLARDRARSGERRRELQARYGLQAADLIAFDAPVEVRRAQLEDCYSQLTEHARKIIYATFCEDHADAHIAGTLELSETNVRVIRHRTLAALRSCLERPFSWRQQ